MVGSVNIAKISLNGEDIESVIDSGSQVSTIAVKIYKNLKIKPDLHQIENFSWNTVVPMVELHLILDTHRQRLK